MINEIVSKSRKFILKYSLVFFSSSIVVKWDKLSYANIIQNTQKKKRKVSKMNRFEILNDQLGNGHFGTAKLVKRLVWREIEI